MDNMEPRMLPYKLLKEITCDFSDEKILGRGMFGVVYKGEDNGQDIAVKLLNSMQGVDDNKFYSVCKTLAELKHQNIVQFVGFCNETEEVLVEDHGKQVTALKVHRALCFEYMQNGSLQKHLSDDSQGFSWNERYKIINGVCEGLKYLHIGHKSYVHHLDLKPDNILFDSHMVPKISDFGLSMLFGEDSASFVEACGYMPPEYIKDEVISKEFDIFSLGVIILSIMTGHVGCSIINDMDPAEVIEHVHNQWVERLQALPRYSLLKVDLQQVKQCVEIAVKCLEQDKHKRLCIGDIVRDLNETETIAFLLRSMRIGKGGRDSMDIDEPVNMPYEFLKRITDGFSDRCILGKGPFGVVYKGEDKEGQEIAVKRLNSMQGTDSNELFRVCKILAKLKHPNIVQFVAFCNETEEVLVEGNIKQVMHRALCFEYMQNGSLLKHLSDESQGFCWNHWYKIINGVCEGLKYFHMEQESPVHHLDLKPNNILLDSNKMPKISDFGLSMLLCEDSVSFMEACGYMKPGYIKDEVISKEFDIFSLGVIILNIMTGHVGCSILNDIDPAEVIECVHNKWTKRLQAMPSYSLLEADLQQVKRCVEIAVKCLEHDRHRRPCIGDIVRELNETETIDFVLRSKRIGKGGRSSMDIGEPMNVPYELLKRITDGFSDGCILGKGSFGVVYKGVDKSGREIAVKRFHNLQGIDDTEFSREFYNLTKLKHQNIVQFVGFCNEEEEVPSQHEGKCIIALKIHRALCFEYMHNGSLQKHIHDEHEGFAWPKRYKIIKGVCEGLKYLHMGLENPVLHLDLKPDNILLDNNMVPKIADFGLSRLIGEENTIKTISPTGTLGYCPPEFIKYQIISKEFDIFSLGVIIIKIMSGLGGYSLVCDMKPAKFIEHVHDKWRERLLAIQGYASVDTDCQQVKKCLEIALECVHQEKKRRPNIGYIVEKLGKTEQHKWDTVSWMDKSGSLENSPSEMASNASRHKRLERQEVPQHLGDIVHFSPEGKIGQSLFGTVYKGNLANGVEIAVMKLAENPPARTFNDVVGNLMKIKHGNIVKLVGFCQEVKKEDLVQHNGRYVIVDVIQSFLCYEYLPKGTLDKYILASASTIGWDTRFKIIKGICQGLHFLHKEMDRPIIHMNLLPRTIWLDDNFVPKIVDFLFSRLHGQEQTRINTINIMGQNGYMAPEYLDSGEISMMSDIYSLGMLIISLTIGEDNPPKDSDRTGRKLVEKVQKSWKKDDHIKSMYLFSDADGLWQVKTCIEIGLKCIEVDRNKRPSITEIVRKLNGRREVMPISTELLDVYPSELRFPFKANRSISCSLQLTNKTDDRVAYRLLSRSSKRYRMPVCGIVPPLSTYTLVVTTREQKKASSKDDDFLTLETSTISEGELNINNASPESAIIKYGNFFKKARETDAKNVDELTLKVIYDPPEEVTSGQPLQSEIEIISKKNIPHVLSVDVHTTEPWIMTSHQMGNVIIWNYKTQESVNSFNFTEEPVYSIKFIEREKWLVAGDSDGTIYVYNYYNTEQEVKSVEEAHDGRITSLAVHPFLPFVLSSSDDHLIKLWNWEDWKCIGKFKGHSDSVTQVNFNPMDTNSFCSVSLDHTIKIWRISYPESKTTLLGPQEGLLCAHNYISGIRHYMITGSCDGTVQIWDLDKERCVQTLKGRINRIGCVYRHPELPLIITGSHDGTIGLWNSTSNWLENIISVNLGAVYAFGYIQDSRRIVVGCHQGTVMMEINFP